MTNTVDMRLQQINFNVNTIVYLYYTYRCSHGDFFFCSFLSYLIFIDIDSLYHITCLYKKRNDYLRFIHIRFLNTHTSILWQQQMGKYVVLYVIKENLH
jgi:hypothetical protein